MVMYMCLRKSPPPFTSTKTDYVRNNPLRKSPPSFSSTIMDYVILTFFPPTFWSYACISGQEIGDWFSRTKLFNNFIWKPSLFHFLSNYIFFLIICFLWILYVLIGNSFLNFDLRTLQNKMNVLSSAEEVLKY